METNAGTIITVQVTVNAPISGVWKCWTTPEDIIGWNNASEDWHTTRAANDLRSGGSFNYRMEARDGSIGFDFFGVYEKVVSNKLITCMLGDGRKVRVAFTALDNTTEIVEDFEAESINTVELQRGGWQAILDNFKKYTEARNK